MGSAASPPVATRLVLVRHGEGRANVERVLAGLRGCTGLTERGRQQVAALGAHWAARGFRPDVLLCSPVRRARESADILAAALHVAVREECALCEVHLGEADGLAWAAYEAHYGRAFDLLAEPDRPCAPGAESWTAVMRRVRGCLDDLATAHAGQTVAIVTHAGFVVASLLELLAIPAAGDRAYLDPAFTSLTCWQHQAGRWTLVSFNEVQHLDDSGEVLPSRP